MYLEETMEKKKEETYLHYNIVCIYLVFILIFIYRKMAHRFVKVLEEEIEEVFFYLYD